MFKHLNTAFCKYQELLYNTVIMYMYMSYSLVKLPSSRGRPFESESTYVVCSDMYVCSYRSISVIWL